MINMRKTNYKNQIFLKKTEELSKKYKKKVIIYLDILGIKDFTLNQNTSDNELCEVYQILKNIADSFSKDDHLKKFLNFSEEEYSLKIATEDLDFSISILSDSIIISFSKNFLFLLPWVLRITRFLQIILIFHGLLARGAVTCNKIYHTKNDTTMLFGKGLVEAYTLESKGDDPIMQIENKLWNQYKRMMEKEGELESIFKKNCTTKGDLKFVEQVFFASSKTAFIEKKPENKICYRHFYDLEHTLHQLSENNFIRKSDSNYFLSIVDKNIEKFQNDKNILGKWQVTKKLIEWELDISRNIL